MSAKVCALVLLAGAVALAQAGGSITDIEKFPSLAQVEFSSSNIWTVQCAATIITNQHLITAVTCFEGASFNLALRRVRVGASKLGYGGEVFGVRAANFHHNFGTLGMDGDIAVIVLDDYLYFGAGVQQAPILGQGIELPTGLSVQYASWGTTAEGGEEASDDLYTDTLLVFNHEQCLVKYIASEYISDNMVCFGKTFTQGQDLDENDIGAPLFYQDTVVGFFSFGKDDADDEYPVVATAVSSYTSWIIDLAS